MDPLRPDLALTIGLGLAGLAMLAAVVIVVMARTRSGEDTEVSDRYEVWRDGPTEDTDEGEMTWDERMEAVDPDAEASTDAEDLPGDERD